MANRNKLLIVDSAINFILGVALLTFPSSLVAYLGVPEAQSPFYPNILGGVFVGIAIALFLESDSSTGTTRGLGLLGAVAINLCGGMVLGAWLLLGDLDLPPRGVIFLWGLVILLAGISLIELITQTSTNKRSR